MIHDHIPRNSLLFLDGRVRVPQGKPVLWLLALAAFLVAFASPAFFPGRSAGRGASTMSPETAQAYQRCGGDRACELSVAASRTVFGELESGIVVAE